MLSGVLPTIDNIEQNAKILLESAFELCQGRPEKALDVAQEAVKNAEPALAAHTLYAVGKAYYDQNHLPLTISALQKTLSYLQTYRNKTLTLDTYLLLGQTLRDLGELDEAAHNLNVAVDLAKKLKSIEKEVEASNLLAVVENYQGKYSAALKRLKNLLPIAQKGQLSEKVARIYNNIGSNYCCLGLYTDALESLKKANALINNHMPKSRHELVNLINIAQVYEAIHETNVSCNFYTQARSLSISINDTFMQSVAINNLAELHLKSGNFEAAAQSYQEGLILSKKENLKRHELYNLVGLGRVHYALRAFQKALTSFSEALPIAQVLGDVQCEVDILLQFAQTHVALEDYSRALETLNHIHSMDLSNYPSSAYEVHRLYAELYAKQQDYEKAYDHHQRFHELKLKLIHEESSQRTRELSIQFDVEHAHQQADDFRKRTELEQLARQKAEEEVRQRTIELEDTRLEIVNRLAMAGEYRDDATGEHTRRVGRNSAIIAFMLGWTEDEVQLIYYAARLHDVGKIGIRDAILLKPGKLTDEEMDIVKSHTTKGAGILSGGESKLLQLAEEIALCHHEKWDGTGYPKQLSNVEIPLSARIVAIADVIDALTHKRVYKDAWTLDDALAEIARLSGSHFDPLLVEIVLRVFKRQDLIQTLDTNDWKAFYSQLEAFLHY